jgi:hypothetical protein
MKYFILLLQLICCSASSMYSMEKCDATIETSGIEELDKDVKYIQIIMDPEKLKIALDQGLDAQRAFSLLVSFSGVSDFRRCFLVLLPRIDIASREYLLSKVKAEYLDLKLQRHRVKQGYSRDGSVFSRFGLLVEKEEVAAYEAREREGQIKICPFGDAFLIFEKNDSSRLNKSRELIAIDNATKLTWDLRRCTEMWLTPADIKAPF